MSSTFLAVLLLLFSFSLSVSNACYTHADCSSGTLVAYCLRVKCIPISGFEDIPAPQPDMSPEPKDTEEPELEDAEPDTLAYNLSRFDVVKLTNADSIPLKVRRATIRRIRSLNNELNVNDNIYRTIHKRSVSRMLTRILKRQTRRTSTFSFHASLLNAVRNTHDLHYGYFPPYPLGAAVATLGFTVSSYFSPEGEQSFVLSDFVPGFSFPPCFARGSIVQTVDGVPVAQAVRTLGEDTYGANEDAKTQRGVDALTFRQAVENRLPREKYATFTVVNPSGEFCKASARWVFALAWHRQTLSGISSRVASPTPKSRTLRFPHERPNTLHFLTARQASSARRTYLDVASTLSSFVSASVVKTSSGDVGVLKVVAFPVVPDNETLAEFTRLLKALPQNGLIIDTRDNQGGNPMFCSMVTRLVSGVQIPRMPMTMRSSKLLSRMVQVPSQDEPTHAILRDFETANRNALAVKQEVTGPASEVNKQLRSADFTSTLQVYHAPVVTLTSAISYSAGDLFALLQKDLSASYVIGVDRATGGGGAGPLSFQSVVANSPGVFDDPTFVEGADVFTPTITFYRTGNSSGGLVEHFGVEPDKRYKRTRNDVLDGDRDLFELAAQKLRSMA